MSRPIPPAEAATESTYEGAPYEDRDGNSLRPPREPEPESTYEGAPYEDREGKPMTTAAATATTSETVEKSAPKKSAAA